MPLKHSFSHPFIPFTQKNTDPATLPMATGEHITSQSQQPLPLSRRRPPPLLGPLGGQLHPLSRRGHEVSLCSLPQGEHTALPTNPLEGSTTPSDAASQPAPLHQGQIPPGLPPQPPPPPPETPTAATWRGRSERSLCRGRLTPRAAALRWLSPRHQRPAARPPPPHFQPPLPSPARSRRRIAPPLCSAWAELDRCRCGSSSRQQGAGPPGEEAGGGACPLRGETTHEPLFILPRARLPAVPSRSVALRGSQREEFW